MNKINPFNPNSTVSPTLFAGRVEQIFNILNKLKQVKNAMPVSFILHGDRGIGKTALSKLIKYIVSGKNLFNEKLSFTTSYYSVNKNQSIQSVLESSLNLLTEQLDKNVITSLRDTFSDILKNGKFTFPYFSYSKDNTIQKTHNLKDYVVSILTKLIKSNIKSDGVLIIIDEIHNLSDLKNIAHIFKAISTTLDVNDCGKISFMLLGSTKSMHIFFEGDDSAKRHFDSIPLMSMSDKESLEILTKGFDQIKVKYQKNKVNQYVKQASGYPHSIQLLGCNIISIDTDGKIDVEDLKKATHKTAIDLRIKNFSSFYNFDGKATLREILLDVLAFYDPITKIKAQKLCCNKNIYHKHVLPKLIEQGAIKENKETSELILHSQLFKTAIITNVISKIQKQKFIPKHLERIQALFNLLK